MGLTPTQEAQLTKLVTSGKKGVGLDDATCVYLVAVIARDLGCLALFDGLSKLDFPEFFAKANLSDLRLNVGNFRDMFERLVTSDPRAETYFYCLATLHKARLSYERILTAQPIPTINQVGPRGLLQYGSLSPAALSALLFWRKWIYDIDNRAAQLTGYLYEPILAHALGGVPASAQDLIVTRDGDGIHGRQVDCIRAKDKTAYEFKLRVTIAASGKGRVREEMDFPRDAHASGYTPVLIVLDPTPSSKLTQLIAAYKASGGHAHVGADAWDHLAKTTDAVMKQFIDKYVHGPVESLLEEAPSPHELPDLLLQMGTGTIVMRVSGEELTIARAEDERLASDRDELAEDVSEHIASP